MDGIKRPSPRPPVRPLNNASTPIPPRPVVLGALPPKPEMRQGYVQQVPQVVATDLPANSLSHDELPPIVLDKNNQPYAPKKRRWIPWLILLILAVLALVGALLINTWIDNELAAVDTADSSRQRVEVKDGDTFSSVATMLKDRNIIRNEQAFKLYAQLNGYDSQLKTGTCQVARSNTSQEIMQKLTSGCHDFKSITFYPGATIEKPIYKPADAVLDQNLNIKSILKGSGYTDEQITEGLNKAYTGPLFEGKPASANLEGYVYGQTYYVDTKASVSTILQTTFDQMYKELQSKDLINKFKQQKLSVFQAVTLASIVQRELNCEGKPTAERLERCYQYQRTIAQIFLKRLAEDEPLGSDVTFIYAADQLKVQPTVDLKSPYNTRINKGLPPGPIASPGIHALMSVGDPTDTDYLFFIAGDDGLIYFAKTNAEHQANIDKHCQKLCNEL